jgi:ABC-type nitrate/sulfonate/bicarbonate transport system substrate-binding protein
LSRRLVCLLIFAGVMLSACSCQAPTVASPASTASTAVPQESGVIRVSLLDTVDVKDVPLLMALESLEEQGYTTEVVNFGKTSLVPAALIQGDIDVASISTTLGWVAAAQGADIASVVGRVNTSFVLVTDKDVRSCSDLDGKAVTFATRQSVGYVMFEEYLDQNCPGTAPEVLLISGSGNRVAGLELGEVDGAYLELQHWLRLQEIAPGQFHVLVDFATEFPEVLIETYCMRSEWAHENRENAEDFIRALLVAHRSVIADPELLRDGIVKYVSVDAAQAQALAEAYLQKEMWHPNGQLSAENIQATLDFLKAADMLPADLNAEDAADLSYLNAVLDEIGRY